MKRFLSSILSISLFVSTISIPVRAQDVEASRTTITPQMTYVDYDDADTDMGYIVAGDTARTGYNNISNGTIGMGNTGWGENKITYLKVDASGITDINIINAILTMEVSGSSDSKRTCEYGVLEVAYTDWDDTLTYNSAVADNMTAGTAIGDTVWSSTKSSTTFETKTIDITDALKNDEDRIVTLAIYETKAAGGYIKNPSVEIGHINAMEYTVTYIVGDTKTTETVYGGNCVSNLPEKIEKSGYTFLGWTKDDDTSELYTTEEIAAMEITSDTIFTAQYEKDESYSEVIITADPDAYEIEATKEEQSIIYNAVVNNWEGIAQDEIVTWTVDGTDNYAVSDNECTITITARAQDMEITVTATRSTNADVKASKQLLVKGYTGETLLMKEEFEISTGGFVDMANTAISTTAAASDGMSGNVLSFIPAKSSSSVYTAFQKEFDDSITSQQFVSVQFDIAAQYRDGKDRVIYFGAHDSNGNPLFLLTMNETKAASIAICGLNSETISDMLPNVSSEATAGTSYHVKAEFNFFTKKQHITITPTLDTSKVIFDKTFDITNAENFGKLGLPTGINWTYGAMHLDNVTVSIPALRMVSFNISDNNSNPVNGAVVTVHGADGLTLDTTSVNGVAEIELPQGDYTYTVNGHGGQCTSITKPVEFTVAKEDVLQEVSLFAFDGPTANKIELSADTDAASMDADKAEKKVVYTAIIRDQDENIMNDEKVIWTVTGTDNYEVSGENSGSTCTVTILSGAPNMNITVTAASKTFDFLNESKTLKVVGYPNVISLSKTDKYIQIPDQGSISSEYKAIVKDSNKNKLGSDVSYELINAPEGVSINDGVLRVLSGTAEAAFVIKAYANNAPEVFVEIPVTLMHDAPSGLMVDLRQEPAGVSKTPGFSWIMNSYNTNRTQSAYQILVASTLEKLNNNEGDVWDSGKVESDTSSNIDYAGNSLEGSSGYYWKVKVWDNDGNESPYSYPQRFFTKADAWTANAIWTPSNSGKGNVIFARKSFSVDREVENALLNITVSNNGATRQYAYKAYINGEYVGLGPQFKTYNSQYFYNSFDVTDYISSGENVVGAICYALSDKKLMAELKITYTDGSTEIIKTDNTWKTMDGTKAFGDDGTSIGTSYYTAMAENINANHYPYGWDMPDYDDSAWLTPETKTAITGLAPSTVDPVGEYEVVPVKIVEKAKGHYFIDLGKEITGGIELEFTDIEAPAELEMRYGEELSSTNTVMYNMRTANTYLEYFTMKEGDQSFKNFGMKNFRYIEILGSPVAITEDNIRGIALRQAFDDDESYFRSDNELLNEIYEFCKYSIKATSQDLLVDSQSRERGSYEGDLYVNQLSMYSFMRNYNLPRFTNEVLAYGPTWCQEYHQMTVMSAWEDYMYTGDTASLEMLYPTLKGKLLDFDTTFKLQYNLYQHGKMGSGGQNQVLVDWPNSQRDGYVSNDTDFNTVVNAFHYAAATDLAKIAGVLGKTEDVEYYENLAATIKKGMEQLYVESEHRFADSMSSGGVLANHYAQHASFFPLALGVVDDEQIMKDIAEEIGADGINCSIYATQFLIRAMYNAGNAEDALAMLTSTTSNKSWYHVMYNLGATIVPECWNPSQKGNMTFSHAWGSSPANLIVRDLCGITPIEAGYKKMAIKPQLGGLKNVEVKAPNIKGYVYMSIDTESKTMDINIPANTTATVYVPLYDAEQVLYMDGVPVAAEAEDEYFVLDNVGSGAHVFTVGEPIENGISYIVEENILKSVTVSTDRTADLYIAEYKDNALVNVSKVACDNIGENTISVDMAISENVKLYLWEKDSIQPICDAETVK